MIIIMIIIMIILIILIMQIIIQNLYSIDITNPQAVAQWYLNVEREESGTTELLAAAQRL